MVGTALVDKGLLASEWAAVVADIVGGKKGGKADAAQGSGTVLDRIDDALKAAEQFARMKIEA